MLSSKHELISDTEYSSFHFVRAQPQKESSEYAEISDKHLATREYKTPRRKEVIFKYTQRFILLSQLQGQEY